MFSFVCPKHCSRKRRKVMKIIILKQVSCFVLSLTLKALFDIWIPPCILMKILYLTNCFKSRLFFSEKLQRYRKMWILKHDRSFDWEKSLEWEWQSQKRRFPRLCLRKKSIIIDQDVLKIWKILQDVFVRFFKHLIKL